MQPPPDRSSRRRAPFDRAARLVCALIAFLAFAPAAAAAGELLSAHGFKMAGDASRMRVVVHFDREPELRYMLMRDPHRLVIDMADAEFRFEEAALEARGMVSEVRHGNLGQGRSRILVSFDGAFSVTRFEVVENETGEGFRLVADIAAASESAFETAMAESRSAKAARPAAPSTSCSGTRRW